MDIEEIFEEIFWMFEDIVENVGWAIEDFLAYGDIEDFIYTLTGGMSIGFFLLLIFIPVAVALTVGIVLYILNGIAFSKFANKLGHCRNSSLAWIPVCQYVFLMLVLSKASGRTDFSIDPKIDAKIKIKDRNTSFLIFVLTYFVGTLIVSCASGIIGFILGFIPFVGPLLSGLIGFILGLIPAAVYAVCKYVYLRDCLDLIKEDKDNNKTMAIIISIASHFIPVVLPIYLLTLLKYEPLPVSAPVEEDFFGQSAYENAFYEQGTDPSYTQNNYQYYSEEQTPPQQF